MAAAHPEHAWFPIARTPAEITTPTADNRMVATPYTKLMTAIMDVDMAAAVLLATEERADRMGVPDHKRVYLRGVGFGEEPPAMAARPDLGRSPALAAAGRAALGEHHIDDVAHLDLYSCFASSLSFARDALGITDGRGLTVTGGLPYHGGPGSNYGTHSLAAMAETLRSDPGSLGLVTGIGMHMTHHAASVWSTLPGEFAPPADAPTLPALEVADGVEGEGRVVTFSTTWSPGGAVVDRPHLRPARRAALLRPAGGAAVRGRRPGRRHRHAGPGQAGGGHRHPVSPRPADIDTPKRSDSEEGHASPLRVR